MKFSGTTDFAASLDDAFSAFADFESFERHALRVGADVQRVDDLTGPGRGMMWKIKAEFRGKPRKIDIELVDYEPNQHLEYRAMTTGFEGVIVIDLVALTLHRTRVTVTMNVKPTSLTARLVLQSARLSRSTINKRFNSRLVKFGHTIENGRNGVKAG